MYTDDEQDNVAEILKKLNKREKKFIFIMVPRESNFLNIDQQ